MCRRVASVFLLFFTARQAAGGAGEFSGSGVIFTVRSAAMWYKKAIFFFFLPISKRFWYKKPVEPDFVPLFPVFFRIFGTKSVKTFNFCHLGFFFGKKI